MYKLITLETGFFLADGGAMFGAIPKRAWSRKYPADENNLCRLAMRCVFATSNTRKILVDTGIKVENAREFSYYDFSELKTIETCLAEIGVNPEDITDVVLTHLHFDHCGAVTRKNEKGELIPTFPYARYWCSRGQWETACHPSVLEVDSFSPADFLPLLNSGKLHLIAENTEIDSNFRLRIFDGHTKGQLACYIDGMDGGYLIPGDVIPTAAHISLCWLSAYDMHAEDAVCSKREMLEDSVEDDRKLIFYHDAFRESAKVVKNGDLYFIK